MGTVEMAHLVKVFAVKLDDLGSIPGTHIIEGTSSIKLSPNIHMHAMACVQNAPSPTYICPHIK